MTAFWLCYCRKRAIEGVWVTMTADLAAPAITYEPVLNAGALLLREYVTAEPLPLATIHAAVLDFLRDRNDVAVFGAQAVNAYVHEPRMTQDIDLMATHPTELAEELRAYLARRFHIAVRVREVAGGRGFRLYQVQKTGNRHLVDIRAVKALPAIERLAGVQVIAPVELLASKVTAYAQRRSSPKAGTDWRDIAMLLLAFPALKCDPGPVTDRLLANMADETILAAWRELVAQPLVAALDEDEF